MAFATYGVSELDSDTTLTNTFNAVSLDTTDITLTLPSASAGYLVVVTVVDGPRVALTNGVVRVVPGTNDFFMGGASEYVTWETGSTLKFIAIDSTYWMLVDVL